jgi:hypothetical protein
VKRLVAIISPLLILVLGSFSLKPELRGQYRFEWWDGRHGHHHLIEIRSNRFIETTWHSNFFHPTRFDVRGHLSQEHDWIVFEPVSVQFFRLIDDRDRVRFKKRKCACSEEGLADIDRDKEWYVIAACEIKKYTLHGDTLISAAV